MDEKRLNEIRQRVRTGPFQKYSGTGDLIAAELLGWVDELDAKQERINQLEVDLAAEREKVARLEAALQKYADDDNWIGPDEYGAWEWNGYDPMAIALAALEGANAQS